MKIIQELSNKLLKRKEVKLSMDATSNPGFSVAIKIAEHFKSTPELVVIKKIKSGFGKSEFTIDAFIYEDVESKSIEPRPKVKKAVAGA